MDYPEPELKEGKRAFTAPYLSYYGAIPYQRLGWVEQSIWRDVVNGQQIALLCRETITQMLSTIDWRIEPKDPTKRQERSQEIKYYTKLFEQNNGLDWVSQVEWILGDALDLPFGYGEELVYSSDDPSKRLVDFIPLDGATLMPTYDREYPVIQYAPMVAADQTVVFPAFAINRMYYSPRREIEWRGWGMAPPEKIYLALQMLSQGDQYYWKLLTDTPEAGILDLIDMDQESAMQWLDSWRSLMFGQDGLKIPVLYEHTKEAKFIPFGRPPSEIMYDSVTLKYAALVAAGYGLSLSDIGLTASSNGGNTLAGTIREERGTKRKGVGFAKTKTRLLMDRRLPNNLEFKWIDPDEEQQVARGRALLSSSTSFGALIDKRVISPKEARQMLIAAGLSATTLPEDIPEEDMKMFDELVQANSAGKPGSPQRQNMLTATQPPSSGGQGEVRMANLDKNVEDSLLAYLHEVLGPEAMRLSDDEYVDYLSAMPLFLSSTVDSLSGEYGETTWEAITKTAKNIVPTLLQARSLALDNETDISDNFLEIANTIVLELANQLNTRETNGPT